MKILTKYIIKQFLKPFLFGLALFTLMVFLVHVFEKMDTFAENKAPLSSVLPYLALSAPDWIVRIAPVAVLLASFFGFGRFSEKGEYVVVRSSGIAPGRFLWPVLALTAALSLLSFAFSETIVPQANKKARQIYLEKILKRSPQEQSVWSNLLVMGREGRVYRIQSLDLRTGVMKRVIVNRFVQGEMMEQIDALEARWEEGQWTFSQGVLRTFGKGPLQEEVFDTRTFLFPDRPKDFVIQNKKPAEMTAKELHSQIAKFRRVGMSHTSLKVAVQVKYAYPLASLAVFALGAPLALQAKKMGRARSFAYTMGIAFCYWGVHSVGQALGESHLLPPWAGAWLANSIFGFSGGFFFLRNR